MPASGPLLDPQTLTALYLTAVLGLTLRRLSRKKTPRPLTQEERHAQNVARSHRVVKEVRKGDDPAIGTLRAVSAHEFEEVVLTALARRGHKILRNGRYTGDGGADGQVWIRGRRYLVQSKRYSAAIKAAHIEEFARLCRQERARGLFVHTGRMGPTSEEAERRARKVTVIHGEALERLVAGRKVRVGRVRL